MKAEIGTEAHMMMIITLLRGPSPHLLVMIGTTQRGVDLLVLREMVEAHPGLIQMDHVVLLQVLRGMVGALQGPAHTGNLTSCRF